MGKLISDKNNLIGVGKHKKCYRHPSDISKCVEIIYNLKEGVKDIKREMRQLKQDMLDNEIITMNISEENIALQTTKEGLRIRLLSDLGSSFFLPTDYWFRSVRLKRVQRHWEKMCNRFVEQFPSEVVKDFVEKIR